MASVYIAPRVRDAADAAQKHAYREYGIIYDIPLWAAALLDGYYGLTDRDYLLIEGYDYEMTAENLQDYLDWEGIEFNALTF